VTGVSVVTVIHTQILIMKMEHVLAEYTTIIITVKIVVASRRWGDLLKTAMECNECGHRFSKTITANTCEAQCPNCHGYDTEPVGVF